MKSCKVGRISYQAIEAARRIISREFRRNGQIWVRVFADIPITSKPTEIRMGKGKGNSTCWIARVVEGQILFEMDGVSLSNAQKDALNYIICFKDERIDVDKNFKILESKVTIEASNKPNIESTCRRSRLKTSSHFHEERSTTIEGQKTFGKQLHSNLDIYFKCQRNSI
jgi:ribosomal protein L16